MSAINDPRSVPLRPARQPWRQRLITAAILSVGFVLLLVIVEIMDSSCGSCLESNGVRPRSFDGLLGILWAPLIHGTTAHLWANSVPLLLLGFILALSGWPRWLGVTALVWAVAGTGVWLVGRDASHIGASSIVFGWLAFLIVYGFFRRHLGFIVAGVVMLLWQGGILWGILPGTPGVSWEGHLFGAVGGVLAAFVWGRFDRESAAVGARARSFGTD